jgi:hypothetical protein
LASAWQASKNQFPDWVALALSSLAAFAEAILFDRQQPARVKVRGGGRCEEFEKNSKNGKILVPF